MIVLKIEIENLQQALEILQSFPKNFQLAQQKALQDAGLLASNRAREELESAGHGRWKKPHPLSKHLFTRKNVWQRMGKSFGNFYGLGRFSRYRLLGKSVLTGFGTFVQSRGQQDKFKDRMMQYSKTLRGGQIHVTPAMRKKMGATRYSKNSMAGAMFFPLRKTTKLLHIPKRLITFDVKKIVDQLVSTLQKSFDN